MNANIKNTRLLLLSLSLIALLLAGLRGVAARYMTSSPPSTNQLSTPFPTPSPTPISIQSPNSHQLKVDDYSTKYLYPDYALAITLPNNLAITEDSSATGVWVRMNIEGIDMGIFAGSELDPGVKSDLSTYKKISPLTYQNRRWDTYEDRPCVDENCLPPKYISIFKAKTFTYALRFTHDLEVGKQLLKQIEITQSASPSASLSPSAPSN